jgi:hypothetical protein
VSEKERESEIKRQGEKERRRGGRQLKESEIKRVW